MAWQFCFFKSTTHVQSTDPLSTVRFCTDAEQRYAPTEGEAAAIRWALEKCCMFILGLPQCYSGDRPEPLKGLFVDRDLSKIHNLCLFWLKEKKLEILFHHVTLPW